MEQKTVKAKTVWGRFEWEAIDNDGSKNVFAMKPKYDESIGLWIGPKKGCCECLGFVKPPEDASKTLRRIVWE